MSMRWLVLVLALTGLGVANAQGTPALASLSTNQRERVERGEPVQVLEAIATSPWPRSVVYQYIDASPEECAAVLSDYERQATYIPRLKSARIVRRSGVDTDVEYLVDLPIYPDERSISRQQVVAEPGEFRVVWQTVVDSQARGSVTKGKATFLAMRNRLTGKTGTLMIHDQSVTPGSSFARVPFVRKKAIEASREAAQAIARQIESERRSNPALLARQIARLREHR